MEEDSEGDSSEHSGSNISPLSSEVSSFFSSIHMSSGISETPLSHLWPKSLENLYKPEAIKPDPLFYEPILHERRKYPSVNELSSAEDSCLGDMQQKARDKKWFSPSDEKFLEKMVHKALPESENRVLEERLGAAEQEFERMKHKFRLLKLDSDHWNERKDLLHLILSYPMKTEADVGDYLRLWKYFSKLNSTIRTFEAALKEKDIRTLRNSSSELDNLPVLLFSVQHYLAKFAFDLQPYLPHDCFLFTDEIEEPFKHPIHYDGKPDGPEVILTWAVCNAILQASRYITGERMKLIAISGLDAGKVAKALKDIPEIRNMFDVILYMSIPQHYGIKEVQKGIAEQLHEFVGTDILQPLDEALIHYKVLLLLDCIDEQVIDPHYLKIPFDHGCVVLATQSHNIYQTISVDMEIRMQYHLLPWQLFCQNVGEIVHSSSALREMAIRLIEECHDHLLAIILLARALKDVTDVGVWELALNELSLQLSFQVEEGMSEVMVRVLKFIWERKDNITKKCIECSTMYAKGEKIKKASLISCWSMDRLVETKEEGEVILADLFDSFLLEHFKDALRMREETRVVLLKQIIPSMRSQITEKWMVLGDAKVVNLKNNDVSELPKSSEWDAKVVNLKNNDISELPESPEWDAKVMVNLKNNDITELPESPERDAKVVVNLKNNDISELSESPEWDVKVVNLKNNKLSELQESPEWNAKVVVDLKNNDISELPESSERDVKVVVNLKNNDISKLSESPEWNAKVVNLKNNDITELPESLEWDAKVVNLKDNEVSELLESPNCSHLDLSKLFLQRNSDMMVIPPLFFEHMSILQVLDLSYTYIKTLPASISSLVSLQKLLLRGCELFMELPNEIGALSTLQVLDMEGTEIMYLPEEIGELKILQQLKVSFCGSGNSYRQSKQISKMIPSGLLSKLFLLKVISIDVNPDDEEWIADVEDIINDLQKLEGLTSLKLYLPKVELLKQFNLSNFRLTVGHHEQRMISRIPHEVEEKFKKHDNFLRYIYGECIPIEIKKVLKHTGAFFLDRHCTVKSLSEFRDENMVKLKHCLLVECNELQTIIDEEFHKRDHKYDLLGAGERHVFLLLEYLGIYYMKNLKSICKGPIGIGCLLKLKCLTLRTCTSLTSIFTLDLLGNLKSLEELIVEDCPKIKSLVSQESPSDESGHFLPSLKKMSLLELPKLVTISNGLCIAPKLERLVIFYCPKLESISSIKLCGKNLKVIKGESEWWDSLTRDESEWSRDHQDYLASIFVSLRRDRGLMAQLTKD